MFLHVLRRPQATVILARRALAANAANSDSASPKFAPKSTAQPPLSSCPPNTVLEGVNYLKGQEPVLALPDEDYPDWLWTILEPKEWPEDGPGGKAARARRKAERQQRIKDQNFMKTQ
ncbi:hypothetical protein HGRIS_012642 [Hohenbuehelia grisea]|uniref:Large ribosomal subunit protein mL54 n=1 Tax=Hohenbuehelia grisea TaxID=104357 RepID=A0ABR3IT38_9AGAR